MWKWILENISNIDSIISIVDTIIGRVISIVVLIGGLVISFLKLKLERNQDKYLKLPIDDQTKQSMKYYIPTRIQIIDPCEEEYSTTTGINKKLIPFFIKEVFRQSKEQYYIILADSGMGKTTFLLKLFFTYQKKINKNYDIVLVPLSLENSIELIKEVENKSNTILLLDGLDEDKYAMEDYRKRLNTICTETQLFRKVIMTCRTQFFSNSESEPQGTGTIRFGVGKKRVEFVKYYIAPFNDSEINTYLKKKYNRLFQRNIIKRAKELINRCPELMMRPMLLSFIDDLIVDETKQYRYVFQIYKELVSMWIKREMIDSSLLYEFSEKVAEYMYINKTLYITEDEIENLCKKFNINIRSIDAKSKSLLNRNTNGIYKFAHKSILEYFLAEKANKELKFRKDITSGRFDGYDMVKLFLGEMSVVYLNTYRESELRDISFDFLQLPNISIMFTKIVDCSFECSNLSDTTFIGANLENVNMIKVDLQKASFRKTRFKNVILREANLSGAILTKLNLKEVFLIGANLTKANLSESNLAEVNLNRANLRGANLGVAHLTSANLNGANLSGANLRGANLSLANLTSANLSGANLRGANLGVAHLISANLNGANLSGANLSEAFLGVAHLTSANLSGANLRGANLRGANLNEAKLREADLRKANLSVAKLNGAKLNGAKLTNTNLDASTWYKDDIPKILPQLEKADFTYIIIEDQDEQKKVYRQDLFPDEK